MLYLPSVLVQVMLAAVSSWCAFVDVKTPFSLPEFVSIPAAAFVRTSSVCTNLVAVALVVVCCAFVDIKAKIGPKEWLKNVEVD